MSDRTWDEQRFLSMLCVYTGAIDGLEGAQTTEARNKFIDLYCDGKDDQYETRLLESVAELQPSNPRRDRWVLLADVMRICKVLRLPMSEHAAYIMASIGWETGETYQPVEEAYYASPAARQRYFADKPYAPLWIGRGDLQNTWITNYAWITRLFTPASAYVNREIPDDYPTNFLAHPENILNPEVSLMSAIIGMKTGRFRRNHYLQRYFNAQMCDPINARLIVNGYPKGSKLPDRAEAVKALYDDWLKEVKARAK